MGNILSFFTGRKSASREQSTEEQPKTYSWDRKSESESGDNFIIANVENEIITREKGSIAGDAMSISDLKNCTVIITDHIGGATVDDCENCDMLLGVSDESVFLRDCKNCRVYTVNPQLRLRDCEDLTISMVCQSQPATEDCTGLLLSPWDVTYEGLQENLNAAKMTAVFNNTWYLVHDFTQANNPRAHDCFEPRSNSDIPEKLGGVLQESTEGNLSPIPAILGPSVIPAENTYALVMEFENVSERHSEASKIIEAVSTLRVTRAWECAADKCDLPESFTKPASSSYIIFLAVDQDTRLDSNYAAAFNTQTGSHDDVRYFFSTRSIL